jgi:hypothetical protein
VTDRASSELPFDLGRLFFCVTRKVGEGYWRNQAVLLKTPLSTTHRLHRPTKYIAIESTTLTTTDVANGK